ncbi:MAG: hypothetical protein Q9172_003071 [Xanthocarpia lactea]
MVVNIAMLLTYYLYPFTQVSSQNLNGAGSTLGTLEAPSFSKFLTSNPLPDGYPWGTRTVENTDPSKAAPHTGVTRYYNFTLARTQIAPDGYLKNMILVNDQFPGPVIEANWGDFIEVQVNNNIYGPEEGTALHWHGLLQTATPWYDGVPSVHQCPVAPGTSFTYRFQADLYGTSWWHAHYSSQYAAGLLGPMIIHGPTHYEYDVDIGPIILADLESIDRTNWLQYSDNNLINGKMSFDCSTVNDERPCTNSAPLSKFKFERGKAHRLRLINAGAAGQQVFSIDGHDMVVIANDYVPVRPYTAKTVFLGVGQRTDVVVKGTGEVDMAYWMRSNISTICNLPRQPQALAKIFYGEADTAQHPTTEPWPYADNGKCNNHDLNLTTPVYAIAPNSTPAKTFEIIIDQQVNATGHLEWRLNQQAFRGNYNRPLLLLAQETNQIYNPEWNIIETGNSTTVRLIINNNSSISHVRYVGSHSSLPRKTKMSSGEVLTTDEL